MTEDNLDMVKILLQCKGCQAEMPAQIGYLVKEPDAPLKCESCGRVHRNSEFIFTKGVEGGTGA